MKEILLVGDLRGDSHFPETSHETPKHIGWMMTLYTGHLLFLFHVEVRCRSTSKWVTVANLPSTHGLTSLNSSKHESRESKPSPVGMKGMSQDWCHVRTTFAHICQTLISPESGMNSYFFWVNITNSQLFFCEKPGGGHGFRQVTWTRSARRWQKLRTTRLKRNPAVNRPSQSSMNSLRWEWWDMMGGWDDEGRPKNRDTSPTFEGIKIETEGI